MSGLAIIGGGFAGWRAARALRDAACEVTLFDPHSETVMLPALPDLAGGWIAPHLLTAPLSKLLPPGVRHDRRAVTTLDPVRRVLQIGDKSLAFDHMLLATGARAAGHPFTGCDEAVHTLDALSSALRLRDAWIRYLQDAPSPHLLIGGGGYTGLELATSLTARARVLRRDCRTTVVEAGSRLLPFLPSAQHARVQQGLDRLGIETLVGARVDRFDGRDASAGGRIFNNVFFCWTAGSVYAGPKIIGEVARLSDGRLSVQSDLSVAGCPDLFVAGDAAAVMRRGEPLRKAVNFAWYEGAHAGRNMLRRSRGLTSRSFRPVDLGWVIPLQVTSVGRIFGALSIHGRTGLRLHYLMCGARNYRFTNLMGFVRVAMTLFKGGVPC
jgi:NADH dehydrogenase